ncbi:universal stress protein, partial [Natronoarchaeum mannanilyticum]
EAIEPTEDYEALVALPEGASRETEATLLSVAADLARPHDGHVSVVQFDEVADQVPLEAATEQSAADLEFEDRTDELASDADVPVQASEIVSHDTRHALANYVEETEPNVLVVEREHGGLRSRILGSDVDWVLEHTDCDAVLVEDRDVGEIDSIAVVTDEGPYDSSKIAVADAIATAHDADVTLEFPVDADGSDELDETIQDYHDEVAGLVSASTSTKVVRPGDTAAFESPETDLLIVGTGPDGDGRADSLVDGVDSSALVVRPRSAEVPGRLGRAIERRLF